MISTPEPTTVIGGGSGQSSTDPYPCSYEEWLTLFSDDYDLDGVSGEWEDYVAWWDDNEFGGSGPYHESRADGNSIEIELYPGL